MDPAHRKHYDQKMMMSTMLGVFMILQIEIRLLLEFSFSCRHLSTTDPNSTGPAVSDPAPKLSTTIFLAPVVYQAMTRTFS